MKGIDYHHHHHFLSPFRDSKITYSIKHMGVLFIGFDFMTISTTHTVAVATVVSMSGSVCRYLYLTKWIEIFIIYLSLRILCGLFFYYYRILCLVVVFVVFAVTIKTTTIDCLLVIILS